MTITICSGYFQRFHAGHATYIENALRFGERTIVIINNDAQQKRKYKEFKNIKPFLQIAAEIRRTFPEVIIMESVDTDGTVCKTLETIYREKQCGERLLFCKDADRNLSNIPEAETLNRLHIGLLQFTHAKEGSSTEIMRGEQ